MLQITRVKMVFVSIYFPQVHAWHSKRPKKEKIQWSTAAHHHSSSSGNKGEKICCSCFPRDGGRCEKWGRQHQRGEMEHSLSPVCVGRSRWLARADQLHFRFSRLLQICWIPLLALSAINDKSCCSGNQSIPDKCSCNDSERSLATICVFI